MSEYERVEREKRLIRIRRVSTFMKWAVTVVLLIVLVIGVVVTIGIAMPDEFLIAADEVLDFAESERRLGDVPHVQRIGISMLAAVAFGLLLVAGWNIRQVFKRFQQMEFFSPRTLANVISFGIWLIVFAVYDLISDPIGSVILTFDYPPGERMLDIALDGSEFFFLILGALMLLFGWILREAAMIADENQQFI
jgi:hypothetical protein